MVEWSGIGILKSENEVGDHFTERAGGRIAPFNFAKTTRFAGGDIDGGSVVHDTTVFAEGFVEVVGGRNIDGDDEIDIVITVGEGEVIFGNRVAIWGDKDFDEVAFELVAEMVGFAFV